MNKLFSFLAGGLSGAVVGAAAALLFTPMSGEALQAETKARIEAAQAEFQRAYDETYQAKEAEFERMKRGAA